MYTEYPKNITITFIDMSQLNNVIAALAEGIILVFKRISRKHNFVFLSKSDFYLNGWNVTSTLDDIFMTIIEIVDCCDNFVPAILESAYNNVNTMAYVDFNPNMYMQWPDLPP